MSNPQTNAEETFLGLLVDYGGVLTNPLIPVLQEFCRSKSLPENAVMEMISQDGPRQAHFHAYERGELTEEEFLPLFADWLGLPVSDIDGMLIELKPDLQMFQAVAEVRRQGIRTCLLSNSWGTALYPRDLLAESFDEVVISEEVGMRKPEAQIFALAAKRIGLRPSQCLFIDDMPSNFSGAHELGIAVIHHERPEVTIREIERLLRIQL